MEEGIPPRGDVALLRALKAIDSVKLGKRSKDRCGYRSPCDAGAGTSNREDAGEDGAPDQPNLAALDGSCRHGKPGDTARSDHPICVPHFECAKLTAGSDLRKPLWPAAMIRRHNRPNTWPHRRSKCGPQLTLANGEPSIQGQSRRPLNLSAMFGAQDIETL